MYALIERVSHETFRTDAGGSMIPNLNKKVGEFENS